MGTHFARLQRLHAGTTILVGPTGPGQHRHRRLRGARRGGRAADPGRGSASRAGSCAGAATVPPLTRRRRRGQSARAAAGGGAATPASRPAGAGGRHLDAAQARDRLAVRARHHRRVVRPRRDHDAGDAEIRGARRLDRQQRVADRAQAGARGDHERKPERDREVPHGVVARERDEQAADALRRSGRRRPPRPPPRPRPGSSRRGPARLPPAPPRGAGRPAARSGAARRHPPTRPRPRRAARGRAASPARRARRAR